MFHDIRDIAVENIAEPVDGVYLDVPVVMIRIFNLFYKLKEIKISDQEWFDQAVGGLMLSDQCCPCCGAKGCMRPHDTYSRYMVTLKGYKPVTESLYALRVKFKHPPT